MTLNHLRLFFFSQFFCRHLLWETMVHGGTRAQAVTCLDLHSRVQNLRAYMDPTSLMSSLTLPSSHSGINQFPKFWFLLDKLFFDIFFHFSFQGFTCMRHIIPEVWWPFGREIVTESGNSFGIRLNHPQIIRMFLDNPDNFPHPSERQIFPQNYCDWSSILRTCHITPKLTQFVFWELLIQSVRVPRYPCFFVHLKCEPEIFIT